jgi:cyclopropane fatty-acyl-phospholipid synthase-like methyltransferase
MYTSGSYLAANRDWHLPDSPWKARNLRSAIDDVGLTFDSAAEIGCGAGGVVSGIAEIYPDRSFVGIDPSPQAINMCKELTRPNLRFVMGTSEALTEPVDLIICFDVFEHVPDYLGFLQDLSHRGRFFAFHVPLDLSAQSVLRPNRLLRERLSVGHLHYYSKETALATLRDCGYRVLHSSYTAGALECPRRSWMATVARWPRRLFFSASPDLAVRLLGGYSLMVLAVAEESVPVEGCEHPAK